MTRAISDRRTVLRDRGPSITVPAVLCEFLTGKSVRDLTDEDMSFVRRTTAAFLRGLTEGEAGKLQRIGRRILAEDDDKRAAFLQKCKDKGVVRPAALQLARFYQERPRFCQE